MLTLITTDQYFDQVLALAKRFPEGGEKNLSREMHMAIANPYRFFLLADIDNDIVRGFLFAALSVWNGERILFIRGYAYDGKVPIDVYRTGWERLKEWGTARDATAIIGFTQRPKGFIRRYQCQVISAVIRKELK